MEHTWEDTHLPKLEHADLEGGDVAVCAAGGSAPLLPALGAHRIAFVAPLASRADLEWLLRGLCHHPNIRHLVVCGDDPKGSGEALVALWKEGLDADARIAGARGRLAEDLDAARIDALRRAFTHTRVRPNGVSPNFFALPQVVAHHTDGSSVGGAFIPSPHAKVAAA